MQEITNHLKENYKELTRVLGLKEYQEIISNQQYIFSKSALFFVREENQDKFHVHIYKISKNNTHEFVDVYNKKNYVLNKALTSHLAESSEGKLTYFPVVMFLNEMVYVMNYHNLFLLCEKVAHDKKLQELLKYKNLKIQPFKKENFQAL